MSIAAMTSLARNACTIAFESYFTAHCIVMEGNLSGAYFPKLHASKAHACKRLCTCGTFVHRAECPHVYLVAVLQHELDLDVLPERKKTGRPKGQPAASQR